jgi:hypothetical protein
MGDAPADEAIPGEPTTAAQEAPSAEAAAFPAEVEAAAGGETDSWDDASALGIEQLPSGPIMPVDSDAPSDAAVDEAAIESIFNDT